MVEIDDAEAERIMKQYCSQAVDYTIMESDNGKFAFTTDDYVLPQGGVDQGTVTTNTSDLAVNLHSFIQIKATVDKTKKTKEFVFVICPFSIKSNNHFSQSMGHLIEATDFGKRDIEITIGDRTTWAVYNEKSLSVEEKYDKLVNIGAMVISIKTRLEIVSQIYKQVKGLDELTDKDSSTYCPYCSNNNTAK